MYKIKIILVRYDIFVYVCISYVHIYVCMMWLEELRKRRKKLTDPPTKQIHHSRSYVKILYC